MLTNCFKSGTSLSRFHHEVCSYWRKIGGAHTPFGRLCKHMEKRKLASVRRGSTQKENMPPMVVSPIQNREAIPAVRPLVLQQCSELLALQESIILSGIQCQREQAQRHETSRTECEDVHSQLDVSLNELWYLFGSLSSLCQITVFLTPFSGREVEACWDTASPRGRKREGSDGTDRGGCLTQATRERKGHIWEGVSCH